MNVFGKVISMPFGPIPTTEGPVNKLLSLNEHRWLSSPVSRSRDAMKHFSGLRVRLVGTVLLFIVPALALVLIFNRSDWIWADFLIGLLALAAAWIGGELFVRRRVKTIQNTALRFAAGDLTTRTGLLHDYSEFGALARALDTMAETLQRQIAQRERSETALLNRAHQQTVIAALGQFALREPDIIAFLNQAMVLVSQTLETEFCDVLEWLPDENLFRLRAGTGWKQGSVGQATMPSGSASQAGFTLESGEPVVVNDLNTEKRFQPSPFLQEHGVVAGITVNIQGHRHPFGVLGAHTSRRRSFTEDEVHFLFSVATLLAMAIERERTEPEIQKLAAFAKFNPNPVLEFSSEGNLTFFNDAAQTMASQLGEEDLDCLLPPDAEHIVQSSLATGQKKLNVETRPLKRVLSWSFHPIMASQVVHCYAEDITERLSLEEQFRQAQKMESVGQLAAGVAHDFNNVLTVIQGHSGLLLTRQTLSTAMTASIQAISFAAERGAGLTRQLLMFSRKQVMQPRPIHLKEVVDNLSKMLQRLLGETISLECKSPATLPPIKGDTGMVEQILMNLAVNARDAMPRGGRLIIGTDPVRISDEYALRNSQARPGDFVCLQVADTGTGMDAATMKRIFEPFFTTKEAGKGTGLGLATVYGIVKQHSGWIEVASQPGEGTTFKIFFPADTRPPEERTDVLQSAAHLRGNGETILVVEDEPVLRDLAQLILQDCGYTVVPASSGVEALTVWQKHQGSIDLLLTDVVMPDGLSGRDLAESLLGYKPGLKVLFTSGYNIDELNKDFGASGKSSFLQKPYSRSTLAKAVRDCLKV
jgi:signal transduction histidine kinase